MNNPGYWTLEDISPEKASQYLATMARNRPPRQLRIAKYASSIKRGRWHLTHQGIAFNCDGSLKDGQHRLLAIIETGTTVQMWVYRGLKQESMKYIDVHAVRTDQHALYIDGMDVDTKDTATARSMYCGYRGDGRLVDRDDLQAFFVRHFDALTFAARLKTSEKGVGHSCVAAVVARAFYHVDHNRLAEFCETLREGVSEHRENFAALRLRNWLQASSFGTGSSSQRRTIYRKSESAVRAFVDRRDITKLYEAGGEEFPIPEDEPTASEA